MPIEKRRYNKQPNVITRSTDEMTVVEKRLMYLVINRLETGFNVKTDLLQNLEFNIPIAELGETNYKRIREGLEKLNSRKMTLIDDYKTKSFTRIIPFPMVEATRSHIKLVMLANIVPYFLELKNGYTQYELEAALALNSVYSQKMYELLSRWRDKKVWKIDPEELKFILGAQNYRYADFKRRCIDIAVDEINTKTDLHIEYEAIRGGKSVVQLNFTIKTLSDKAKETVRYELDEIGRLPAGQVAVYVKKLLNDYSFSKEQKDLIMQNSSLFHEFVELESKIVNGVIKGVKNPTAYMASVLFQQKTLF